MIVRQIVLWFINLLPSFTAPFDIIAGVANAVSWGAFLNYYIPVDTFFVCLTSIVATIIACIVLSAILQII
jgi:hypothetical protein